MNKLARKGMTAALAAIMTVSMAMPAMANTQTTTDTSNNITTTKTITVTNTTDKANDSTKGTSADPYTVAAGSTITLNSTYTSSKKDSTGKAAENGDMDTPTRVEYTSSNAAVAKTALNGATYDSKNGASINVSGVAAGSAVITSTFYNVNNDVLGKIETYVQVTRANNNITSAVITDAAGNEYNQATNSNNAASLNLLSNKTAKITVTAKGTVSYSSLNENVATVDKDGNITAVGEGSGMILVTAAATGTSNEGAEILYVNVSRTADQDVVTITDDQNNDLLATDSELSLDAASTTLSGSRHTAKLNVTSAAGATPTYTVTDEKDTAGAAATGKIVSVASDGTVTAGAAGTATIKVTIPAVTGKTSKDTVKTIKVTVNAKAQDPALTVPSDQTVKVGDSITVKADGTSTTASDYTLEVNKQGTGESPAGTVTITRNTDGSFNVKGNYEGVVTLKLTENGTASSAYRTTSKTFKVSVRNTISKADNTLAADPNALSMTAGETVDVTISSNSTGDYTVKNSDSSIASVEKDGDVISVTANKSGTAYLTITSPEDTNTKAGEITIPIAVSPAEKDANNLTVTPESLSLTAGKTSKISAESNSTGAITYTSNDESVAKVASDGTVTAVKAGTAFITVSSAGDDDTESAEAIVPVTVKSATVKKPGTVKNVKLSNVKGTKVQVKYSKVSGATGYQIKYKVGKTTYKTKTKKTTVVLSKGIKKNTKVKVNVRAYKTSNGSTVYGSYSSAKSLKVDKK